ncbi:TetR family transcriptional regulator [Epidermidibacterium keratini]|uniref:TetR family transcriptional regulator n=1 Tax=Epidermidibacterium keratini TaxID=1891644 RepID=A0A7L4YLX3_9ACTN|nr:TetR family transcriptional regulator [Epidermidibacterium keratini]QHC00130.1 TetR family transcriptional regulator [Epidermidibacterium keratini]
MTSTGKTVTRRPRDRRDRILQAATARFHRDGYSAVSMADIASDVEITAGALYRHFPNKQQLLVEVMLASLDRFEEGLYELTDITQICDRLIDSVLAREHRGILIITESRELDDEQYKLVADRSRAIMDWVAEAIRRARPELSKPDAALLGRSVISVILSPTHHRAGLRPRALHDLLWAATDRVWRSAAVPHPAVRATKPERLALHLLPRREQILYAATQLISEHGYREVTIEQIADAVDIAPSSLYNHFPGKAEILIAAIARAGETMRVGLRNAVQTAADRDEALRMVVEVYVDVALRSDSLIGSMEAEVGHLPSEDRRRVRAGLEDFVRDWAPLVDAPADQARVLALAAIALVNDRIRMRSSRARPGIRDELVSLAHDVLSPT